MNTQYFKVLLQKNGMSQRELARHLDRTPTATLLMLRGERKMRLEDATEMARLFQVQLDEILENAGISQEGVKKRDVAVVVGWVDGEYKIHEEGIRGEKKVPAPSWGASRRLKCLRYQTNGTPLEAMNSALVYFNETEGEVTIDDIGRLAVIETEGSGGVFLGTIKRASAGGFRKFDIYSPAGGVLKVDAAVKSVNPVVWIKI